MQWKRTAKAVSDLEIVRGQQGWFDPLQQGEADSEEHDRALPLQRARVGEEEQVHHPHRLQATHGPHNIKVRSTRHNE